MFKLYFETKIKNKIIILYSFLYLWCKSTHARAIIDSHSQYALYNFTFGKNCNKTAIWKFKIR